MDQPLYIDNCFCPFSFLSICCFPHICRMQHMHGVETPLHLRVWRMSLYRPSLVNTWPNQWMNNHIINFHKFQHPQTYHQTRGREGCGDTYHDHDGGWHGTVLWRKRGVSYKRWLPRNCNECWGVDNGGAVTLGQCGLAAFLSTQAENVWRLPVAVALFVVQWIFLISQSNFHKYSIFPQKSYKICRTFLNQM